MSTTIIHKGYKANVAIDMVKAALAHYKQYERPVGVILLDKRLWGIFKRGMIELNPEKEDDLTQSKEVEFKDCIVKQGSMFMTKSMIVELKKRVLE